MPGRFNRSAELEPNLRHCWIRFRLHCGVNQNLSAWFQTGLWVFEQLVFVVEHPVLQFSYGVCKFGVIGLRDGNLSLALI